MRPKQKRGFAAMDPESHRAMAKKGGLAAHAAGTAHKYTSAEAAAGRKGGTAASRDREYMREIGRRGGLARRRKKVAVK